eukprot:1430660-Amphidinium_carterae.1
MVCKMLARAGYDVSLCNPGDDRSYGIPESECTVSCATGYAGSGSPHTKQRTFACWEGLMYVAFSGVWVLEGYPNLTLETSVATFLTSLLAVP